MSLMQTDVWQLMWTLNTGITSTEMLHVTHQFPTGTKEWVINFSFTIYARIVWIKILKARIYFLKYYFREIDLTELWLNMAAGIQQTHIHHCLYQNISKVQIKSLQVFGLTIQFFF